MYIKGGGEENNKVIRQVNMLSSSFYISSMELSAS